MLSVAIKNVVGTPLGGFANGVVGSRSTGTALLELAGMAFPPAWGRMAFEEVLNSSCVVGGEDVV